MGQRYELFGLIHERIGLWGFFINQEKDCIIFFVFLWIKILIRSKAL